MNFVVEKLIKIFSKFPTIGPRTASRFVYYLIKLPQNQFDELIETLLSLRERIKLCSFCFNPFESENGNLCSICLDNSRDKNTLCIVEKENDLTSIEKTNKYKGLYFILGGTISGLKPEDIQKLRINQLEERIKDNLNLKEIIMALNPTVEGQATSIFLEKRIKSSLSSDIKITYLAKGLPSGGELEYADEETLENAFQGRK